MTGFGEEYGRHEGYHAHKYRGLLRRAKPYLIGAGSLLLLQMACGKGCSSHGEELARPQATYEAARPAGQALPPLEMLVRQ